MYQIIDFVLCSKRMGVDRLELVSLMASLFHECVLYTIYMHYYRSMIFKIQQQYQHKVKSLKLPLTLSLAAAKYKLDKHFQFYVLVTQLLSLIFQKSNYSEILNSTLYCESGVDFFICCFNDQYIPIVFKFYVKIIY